MSFSKGKLTEQEKYEILKIMYDIKDICHCRECNACPFGSKQNTCKYFILAPCSWNLPSLYKIKEKETWKIGDGL